MPACESQLKQCKSQETLENNIQGAWEIKKIYFLILIIVIIWTEMQAIE